MALAPPHRTPEPTVPEIMLAVAERGKPPGRIKFDNGTEVTSKPGFALFRREPSNTFRPPILTLVNSTLSQFPAEASLETKSQTVGLARVGLPER